MHKDFPPGTRVRVIIQEGDVQPTLGDIHIILGTVLSKEEWNENCFEEFGSHYIYIDNWVEIIADTQISRGFLVGRRNFRSIPQLCLAIKDFN
jgi:hypothetical protein